MKSVSEISAAALAYLGDSVLETCVRTYLVAECGISSSARLNRASLSFVTATAQSEAVGRIENILTEEETGYYHRGRNNGQGHVPKNSSVGEYRRATGMEALFGALALAGRTDRVNELFRLAYGIKSAEPEPAEPNALAEGE